MLAEELIKHLYLKLAKDIIPLVKDIIALIKRFIFICSAL